MNLQQAKIILEKINTLYKNISIDENNISSIEKDLMLNYVRQLYEAFLTETNTPISSPVVRQAAPPPPVVRQVVQETPNVAPAPEPKVVKEVVRKKPIIIDVPDSIKEYTAPPVETVKATQPAEPTPVAATETKTSNSNTLSKSEYETLFDDQKGAKELSDKLSSLPIKDLAKAMGLNEKILTINELFDGDHRVFDETVSKLNALSSFEEAKSYLAANVADKYAWATRGKKKKAKIFIKLIKRRYL